MAGLDYACSMQTRADPASTAPATPTDAAVIEVGTTHLPALARLLEGYGIQVARVADGDDIPGSYWGEREAGLIGNTLHVRRDTPLHSALHEACHYLCMDEARRTGLHTDAGGDDAEEEAVCYLQTLLADQLPGYSHAQLLVDMDAWGYHFILGSGLAWYEQDSADASQWLIRHGLIHASGYLTGQKRA